MSVRPFRTRPSACSVKVPVHADCGRLIWLLSCRACRALSMVVIWYTILRDIIRRLEHTHGRSPQPTTQLALIYETVALRKHPTALSVLV